MQSLIAVIEKLLLEVYTVPSAKTTLTKICIGIGYGSLAFLAPGFIPFLNTKQTECGWSSDSFNRSQLIFT